MSPQVAVAVKAAEGWRASPQLRAVWSGFPPLIPSVVIADAKGVARPMFRGLWRQRYGTTLSPVEPIVTDDGKGTAYFLGLLP